MMTAQEKTKSIVSAMIASNNNNNAANCSYFAMADFLEG
jgi:hypothetical protein